MPPCRSFSRLAEQKKKKQKQNKGSSSSLFKEKTDPMQ